jgi:hypothetical protein
VLGSNPGIVAAAARSSVRGHVNSSYGRLQLWLKNCREGKGR